MAVFSVNQATQFYVGVPSEKTNGTDTYFEISDKAGEGAKVIGVTDRIKAGHIISYTTASVSELNVKYTQKTIKPISPVVDAEYLVKLIITTDAGPQYAYIKSVPVLGKDLTATTLAKALNDAAKRDPEVYYEVSEAGIITPKVYHTVGKRFMVPQIEVEVVLISGKDTQDLSDWVTKSASPVALANTGIKKLQDLEYFCAGEKGDVYRGAMWPNEIPFESKLAGVGDSYLIHTIHYYEDLSNEAAQKSEKTMVIVTAGTTTDLFAGDDINPEE